MVGEIGDIQVAVGRTFLHCVVQRGSQWTSYQTGKSPSAYHRAPRLAKSDKSGGVLFLRPAAQDQAHMHQAQRLVDLPYDTHPEVWRRLRTIQEMAAAKRLRFGRGQNRCAFEKEAY